MAMPMELEKPPGKQNISEMISSKLRSEILAGAWKPGQRIPSESKLCETMGVSRVTVRAAINRLAGQGLLESKQGGGTFVRTQNCADEFNSMIPYMLSGRLDRISMFEFRKIIEVASIELAAMRADVQMIDRMYTACDAMEQATDIADIARFDLEFHCLVATATNNPVILRVFEIIQETYMRPMLEQNITVMGATGAAYHGDIIRAVERRDIQQAKTLMEEHLNNAMQMTAGLNM